MMHLNSLITKVFSTILEIIHVIAFCVILASIFVPSFTEGSVVTTFASDLGSRLLFADDLGSRLLIPAIAFISYVLFFGTVTVVIANYQKLCELNERLERIALTAELCAARLQKNTEKTDKAEPSID
jgi:hypothetical protein